MHKDEKQILWRTSATMLGAAMPLFLLGKAVLVVLLALGLVSGLVATKGHSLRSSIQFFLSSKMLWLSACVVAAFGVSSVFALNPQQSVQHFLQMSGVFVFAFLFYLVLREMPSRYVHLLLQVLVVVTLFVAVLAGLDSVLNDQRLAQALHGRKALMPNRLAFMSNVLAVLLPFVWAWLVRRHREQHPLALKFAVPVVVGLSWVVVLCGGQSGVLAFVVSSLVFAVYAFKTGELDWHWRQWVGLAIGFVSLPLVMALVKGVDGLVVFAGLENGVFFVGSDHIAIWRHAAAHLLDSPLTGIGLNGFRNLPMPPEGLPSVAHPHNFVLQIMLETGVVGSVFVFVLFGWIFYRFWGYARKNLFGVAALASLVAFMIASLADTSIFQPWWVTFFVFLSLLGARVGWAGKR